MSTRSREQPGGCEKSLVNNHLLAHDAGMSSSTRAGAEVKCASAAHVRVYPCTPPMAQMRYLCSFCPMQIKQRPTRATRMTIKSWPQKPSHGKGLTFGFFGTHTGPSPFAYIRGVIGEGELQVEQTLASEMSRGWGKQGSWRPRPRTLLVFSTSTLLLQRQASSPPLPSFRKENHGETR